VYPEGLTKETGLRARARHHHRQVRQVSSAPDEAAGYIAGVHGLQRPSPARDIQRREDAVRRVLLLQGDRHVLPDRTLDRDQGRGTRRPTRWPWNCGSTAGVRPAAANTAQDARLHPAPGRVPLGPGLLGRGHPHHRDGYRAWPRSSPNPFEFYLQPGDSIEAEIEGRRRPPATTVVHLGPPPHDTPPYSHRPLLLDPHDPGHHDREQFGTNSAQNCS